MRHNDSQGFPDPWTAMTDEDWAEMDKYAEEAHKNMKDDKSDVNLLDKKTWSRKPPF